MITSTANPQMKNIAALLKKPRERSRQRLFVAEGERLCMEAPPSLLQTFYVSESYFSEEEHRRPLAGKPVVEVSDAVFRAISDTKTPQGILGLIRMPEYELSDLLAGEDTRLLLLEGIQDPGNLGTMLRTGEGAGLTGVIMDRATVDLFHPKVVRATMGSIFRLPCLIVETLSEVLPVLLERGVAIYAAHLKGTADYDRESYLGACGFLIGNEANGLTEETAAFAQRVRIPMEGRVESLNAAVAAALLMYECSRQRRNRSGAYEDMV